MFPVALALAVATAFLSTASAAEGTFALWLKPHAPSKDTAWLTDASGGRVLRIDTANGYMIRAFLAAGDGKTIELRRGSSDLSRRTDEWIHVALVWEGDDRARLFVNGTLYGVPTTLGDRFVSVKGNRLHEAAAAGGDPELARDLVFERRAWKAREVLAAYRAKCPVDLVMDDALVRAGEPASPVMVVAPGNWFMRPKVAADVVPEPAEVELSTEVEGVADTRTPFAKHDVKAPIAVPLEPRAYAEGRYRLKVLVRRPGEETAFLRSLFFRAMPKVRLAAEETKDPWRKTETVFEKSYRTRADVTWESGGVTNASSAAGEYMEVGAKNGNRFADVLTLPPKAVGKPCLVEIDWPDDKPRAMGLYIYEIIPNSCRDHLQGGLVAGEEILNSGRMLTRSYLYYPWDTNVLFEARTMIADRPAALARVRISLLEETFPVLKVRRPKSCRGRSFGHTDEDQTFQTNFTRARGGGTRDGARVDEPLNELIRYFRYTGQDAFSYSTLRYLYDYGAHDGGTQLGMWPHEQGTWRGILRELSAHGIRFVSQQAMAGMPTFGHLQLLDADDPRRALRLRNPNGDDFSFECQSFGQETGDISFPEVRQICCDDYGPTLEHLVDAGAAATVLYLANPIASVTAYSSPAYGGADLVRRAANVTATTRAFIDRVRRNAPEHPIILELAGDESEYREHGVDAASFAGLPGVRFLVNRQNTHYYWRLFAGAGMAETDNLDRLYDPDAPEIRRLAALSPGGSLPVAYSQPAYFETFVKPLGNDRRFGNYFQDADVKPHGRWFLKEPAYCLAKGDVLDYAIGMLPIGSLGNEAETREFVQAYGALPAKPFRTIPGCDDPVVARYLQADEGTYVYAVNYCHVPVVVEMRDEGRGMRDEAEDLSTDEKVDLARIELKPFQLRSFLLPGRKDGFALRLLEADRRCFDARQAEIDRAFAALAAAGVPHEAARKSVARARAALAEGRLAAAHHGFFACAVNGAVEKFRKLDLVLGEAKMNRAGRWAVNCGSASFTMDGGRAFSPDRKWDGETYGWYGPRHKIKTRDVELVSKDSPLKEVFGCDCYDIEGYKFKLPRGRYHVTIHAKWGYPRSFEVKDLFGTVYRLNGKDISGVVDFAKAQGGDITRPLAFEGEVDVEDVLDISIDYVGTHRDGGTTRFINAIEIERKD